MYLRCKMQIGKIIIITAPSGSGKTSVTRHLLTELPLLAFSVSATTRPPRAGEIDGKDYHFLTELAFQQKIKEDAFLEWEMVYEGRYYGTLRSELVDIWGRGKVPVLDIDVKGAENVQKMYPGCCFSIFLRTPTLEILSERLQKRGTETEETLALRLSKAEYELGFQSAFDVVIVNDVLSTACTEAEMHVKQFLD